MKQSTVSYHLFSLATGANQLSAHTFSYMFLKHSTQLTPSYAYGLLKRSVNDGSPSLKAFGVRMDSMISAVGERSYFKGVTKKENVLAMHTCFSWECTGTGVNGGLVEGGTITHLIQHLTKPIHSLPCMTLHVWRINFMGPCTQHLP